MMIQLGVSNCRCDQAQLFGFAPPFVGRDFSRPFRAGIRFCFCIASAGMANQRSALWSIENFTSYQEDKFWRKKSLTTTKYDLSTIFERYIPEKIARGVNPCIWGRTVEKAQNVVEADRHRPDSD